MLAAVRFALAALYTVLMSAGATLTVVFAPRLGWTLFAGPWGRGALRLLDVRVDILNAERLRGPAIFAVNHQTYFDVVLFPAIIPAQTLFIAKRELKRIPLWGWAFARGGAVLIDRANAREAVATMRTAVQNIPPGWSLIVFPEGTRSRNGILKPFKKGVVHLGMATRLPIVPIGTRGVVERGGAPVKPGTIVVAVGEPIDTSAWRDDDPIEHHLAEVRGAVEQQIARAEVALRDESSRVSPC